MVTRSDVREAILKAEAFNRLFQYVSTHRSEVSDGLWQWMLSARAAAQTEDPLPFGPYESS